MENYLEYIDAYFNGTLNDEERKIFGQKITDDKDFADEVAFYLSAKEVLKEETAKEKKEWFRQLATQDPPQPIIRKTSSRRFLLYRLAAAAAVVGVVFLSWFLFFQKSSSPNELADNYVKENFQKLPVSMSGKQDSLQEGLNLYNDGKLNQSLERFELILQRDSENFRAKKYAGIVYLRLANYDKALLCFQQLEKFTLVSNPAKFYQALTLMKRNAPGDKQQAKQLLRMVADQHLEGEKVAQQWFKKL